MSKKELLKELTSTGALLSAEVRASDEILNLVRPKSSHTTNQTDLKNNETEYEEREETSE